MIMTLSHKEMFRITSPYPRQEYIWLGAKEMWGPSQGLIYETQHCNHRRGALNKQFF